MSTEARDPTAQASGTGGGLWYVLWIAALLFTVTRFIGVENLSLSFDLYDEGAYYYGAVLAADGLMPYADYFYAHPPGLLIASLADIRAGFGLGELRIIYCAFGILLPIGVAFLSAQFASERRSLSPPIAALLVAISQHYQNHSRTVVPDTPAVTLLLFAAGFFFRPGFWSPCLSAVLLSGALLFKLQAAVILPWLGISAIVYFGWRDGSLRLLRFGLTLTLAAGAIFGTLAVAVPNSLDCIVGFQARRARLPLVERSRIARGALLSLELGLGLVMASLHLARRDPGGRCLGLAAFLVAAGISFGANSLYEYYYFYLLPFAAASTAAMLTPIAWSGLFPSPRAAIALAMGSFLALSGPTIVARVTETTRRQGIVSRSKDWLADLPGEQLLTADPAILILSGKRAVPDYFAADPSAAALIGQYDTWIARTVDRADAVVVNDRLLSYIGLEGVQAIRASGKPIRFQSPANRDRWDVLIGALEARK